MTAEARLALPLTEWALTDVAPGEWAELSLYLETLLRREPLASGAAWAAHRLILGCLASELAMNARDAGVPLVIDPREHEAAQQAIEAGWARLRQPAVPVLELEPLRRTERHAT